VLRKKGALRPGQTFRYQITVKNTGKVTALNVKVCESPSSKLVYASAPGAKFAKGEACWKIAKLAPGKSKTYRVTVRVDSTVKFGVIRSTAVAAADNALARVRAVAKVRVYKKPSSAARPAGVTG
jgi:uncharacterized repeat protein (TIGR01451 family)